MDKSAWRCETAISCAALRRNIGRSCCVSRRHLSKCSPPSSSGENDNFPVETRLSASPAAAKGDAAATSLFGGKMKRRFVELIVVLGCALCVFSQTQPAAELIIQNERVWTVDPSRPEADAVAVLGDRIVAVGPIRHVDALCASHTRVIDAAGMRLLPGFNDAHVHFADGGSQLDNVQLNGATSPQEFARRIRERAAKTARGEWELGGDWDETKWSP